MHFALRISLALSLGCALYAQEFRAALSGTVLDSSGAVIEGAKVTATGVERQLVSETVTNQAGLYSIQGLIPGKYTLVIEKAGFRSYRQEGLTLASGDRPAINVTLELGAVAETVRVESSAPLLQTETASRGNVIENRLVESLPAAGRNFYQVQFLMPGVVKTSNYWGSFELYAYGNINAISINGGRRQENESMLDGVSNTMGDRGVGFVPAMQSIQEFTTNSNIYDAQYGRVGGGVTQVTLKSGTNRLHGQLYEFLKNDKLNANSWEGNAAGEPKAPFKNNTFGFEVNGPVYIPKVFDGRNRMFFLLSYEGLREPTSNTIVATVPTASQIKGDFSNLTDANGQRITLYDPLSTRLGPDGRYVRDAFPNNVIPSNRINPAAAALAALLPAPNRATGPDGQYNFAQTTPSPNSYNQWLGKLDLRLGEKDTVSFRYGETPWMNRSYTFSQTSIIEPSTEFPSTRIPRNLGLNWDHIVSPSMIVGLRAGLSRYEGFSGNPNSGGVNPATLGFSQEYVSQLSFYHVPAIRFSSYAAMAPDRITQYETRDTYTLQPTLSWMRGRHALKMGAELRRYNSNRLQPGLASGLFNFNRAFTQSDPLRGDSLSGNEFATFLLGYPTSGRVDRNIDPAYRNHYFGLYLQDDFKLRPNLTVNIGLRWDFEQPNVERYNRMISTFDVNAASPLANAVPNLRGGLTYVGDSGSSREAFARDYNNFQPRIGIAWSFTPKWVMRAGYGLSMLGQSSFGQPLGFSRQTAFVSSTDGGLTPAATLDNPFPRTLFPSGLLQPVGNTLGLATDLGFGVSAPYHDRKLPSSQQFSFGLQRQIGVSWLAEATYSGNLTRGLPVSLPLNFIPGAEQERLPVGERPAYFNAQVPNPFAGRLPGSRYNGATVPRSQLLKAFPQYDAVTMTDVPIGRQDYHSLQMMLKRRFSAGLSAQFAYTWSKALEETSVLNEQDVVLSDIKATNLERRLAEFDVTHNFSAVASYELPFGRGKRFLGNSHSIVNGILGGWNLTTQWVLHSGFPLPFPNAAPIKSGSPALNDSERDARATAAGRPGWNPHVDPWFDTSFFPRTAQAPFTQKNFPTRFADVRGSRRNVWEFSAYKEFPIVESVRFQLRGDFNNAFNTPFWPRLATTSVEDPLLGTMRFDPQNQTRVVVIAAKLVF